MVSALLSSEVSDRLEPLRITLGLDPSEFSEGGFSWRGFLYYKWSLEEFWPDLITALRDLKTFRPAGKATAQENLQIETAKRAIIRGVKTHNDDVRRIIDVHDNAHSHLVERQAPQMFRGFLLDARSCFWRWARGWA
jgi:hypothetical protein